MKIANREARSYVQQRKPFRGSNLYAIRFDKRSPFMYVVYSYGTHWPLFIYTNEQWFENSDKYSVTTSRHRTQSHPHCETTLMPSDTMLDIVRYGIVGLTRQRLGVAA